MTWQFWNELVFILKTWHYELLKCLRGCWLIFSKAKWVGWLQVCTLHASHLSLLWHLEWACGLSSLGQRCGMPGCPYGSKPVTLANIPCYSWQPSIPGGVLESTLWTMMISRAVMYWESSSVFAGESCHTANAIGARTMCAGKGRNMVVNLAV